MTPFLLLGLLLSSTLAAAAEPVPSSTLPAPDLRPELKVDGRVDSIEVAPTGGIWFGTATGHVYVSRDWNRTWKEVSVPVRQWSHATISYDNISQIRFFDADRAVISGYLGDSQNLIYRTADGGATWSPVTIPSSLWVYDLSTTPTGLGWLVGSDGSLLYSDDYGVSWKSLRPPFDQASRSESVHFVSRLLGIVGSHHGSLKLTEDGGKSWRRLRSPIETKATSCDYTGVRRVRIQGERVIVQQCESTFVRNLHGRAAWQPLKVEGKDVVSFELTSDDMVAVDSSLEVVRFSPDLRVTRTGFRLEGYPLDITAGAGRVVFLDANLKLAVLNGDQWESSRMFGTAGSRRWPIDARDRGPDGNFWGISRFFLYKSADAGATWERQAEVPQPVEGVAMQDSGDVLVWNRHGFAARWVVAEHTLVPVAGLDGLDIVGLFRRGRLWAVYGGMQYQTTRRIEVARTYFSGQFSGSADHGFVAASTDGGQSWRVVDEWKEEGVQALFLGEDNTLTLLSWLGAIRRGRLTYDNNGQPTAALETILPATQETLDRVPYVEDAHVLYFPQGEQGWVKGWTHHLDDSLYYTSDGGRTWAKKDLALLQPERILRLQNGSWIGFVPPRTIDLWKDGSFASFRNFDRDIEWSFIDATGSLVLELEGGVTWILSGDSNEWRHP
jgi:photosystem II stability/assembly factor-like uncharacterized protein